MSLLNEVEGFFEGKDKDAKPDAAAVPAANVTAPAPGSAQPQGAAVQSAIPHRTLLIHGYSASGAEFEKWKSSLGPILTKAGVDVETIEVGNYISLNNEVTIKDLGEGFDRALRFTKWSTGSKDDLWTFDAIVHSTGMLVLRQWLTSDPFRRKDAAGNLTDDPRSRTRRLKHLVGLAPATFGSPQGKKGRSWLGALVKGNKDFGPDFMNAGDAVLDGLELASSYTWELAKNDMLCDPPMYDQGDRTPYVAVFIGNVPYSGISAVANSPGSDGTVRWAGCALNTRMVQLDFRREPKLMGEDGNPTRASISKWADGRLACPMLAVEGKNHGSILSAPDDEVAARICDFLLTVNTDETYSAWLTDAIAKSKEAQAKMDADSVDEDSGGAGWQQFVLHVKDDHGDGINDYNVKMFVGDTLSQSDDPKFPEVPLIVDTYSGDASYRCFYVRLNDEMLHTGTGDGQKKVWIELIASSGTAYLEYEAYTNGEEDDPDASVTKLAPMKTVDPTTSVTDLVKLELTDLGQPAKLFYPYTTTLVEITLEREPTPLRDVSNLFQFWQGGQVKNA